MTDEILSYVQLTHRGRHKMVAISQTTFSNGFSWMKMYEIRLTFHSSLFVPKGQINDFSALVQIMAWRRPGDKPLSEPMTFSLLTHTCVTQPQWVNDQGMDELSHQLFNADVITHPCHNFIGGLVKPLLKLGHGWVNASHCSHGCTVKPV